MAAEVLSSSSSDMSSATCGAEFLLVEFLIFLVVFLAGFASNALFILVSFKKLVNAKGCFQHYNDHLVHCSIANLILLMFSMPLDVISFTHVTSSGSWFFGEYLCR